MKVLPSKLFLPFFNEGLAHYAYGGNLFTTVFTIDAADEKGAYVFRAPKSGTVKAAYVYFGTISTGGLLRMSLQELDSDGHPDGTDVVYRDITVLTAEATSWRSSGILSDDGTDDGELLGVTVGDPLSLVLYFNTFISQSIQFRGVQAIGSRNTLKSSDRVEFHDGSAWTQLTGSPLFVLEYDDGEKFVLPEYGFPCVSSSTQSFHAGSSPNEVGMRYIFNTLVRVSHLWATIAGAGSNFDINLYDDENNVLASVEFTKGHMYSQGSVGTSMMLPIDPVILLPGREYFVSVLPKSTSNISLPYAEAPTSDFMAIAHGRGEFYSVSRSTLITTAWTTAPLRQHPLGVVLDQIQERMPSDTVFNRGVN